MSEKPPRIIIVDDDPELRALLQRFLTEHGHDVRAVASGAELDRTLARAPADLVILDLMMPGEDGLAICRRLRAAGETIPILMLTARGDPVDRIVGLEMGADDYLAKPFTPREIVARIAAILRRTKAAPQADDEERIAFGPYRLNLSSMTLTRDGEPIPLSSREFNLLAVLARSRGRPLSRAILIERAIGRDAEVTDRAIDVQIARIRRTIGDDSADPRWIRTVWGVGYMLAGGDAPC